MKELILSREVYLEHNRLINQIIGAAIEVHKELGPGLSVDVYESCLKTELENRRLQVYTHIDLPVIYKGNPTGGSFHIDMIVEDKIIVDLLCVDSILPVHEAQLASKLRLASKAIGLTINFNVPLLKDGVKRKMNARVESDDQSVSY